MRTFKERCAGVLLPVFSLPSPYGIGTFGKEAYRFIDFLQRSGHRYWQMLPLTLTGYGDSPYQSVSTFAGNPYFIDLDDAFAFLGIERKIALRHDHDTERVDYGRLYKERYTVLRRMYALVGERLRGEVDFVAFIRKEEAWLRPFAIFMTLKNRFLDAPWQSWGEPYRTYEGACSALTREDKEEEGFWYFTQYLFFHQYGKLKAYAESHGVEMIGDLPLYVSLDSVDVWSSPSDFLLDEAGMPTEVAGVPPDNFSEDGQRWGNPLYDWAHMEATGFSFWRRRVSHAMTLFSLVRIDHFIGIVRYYAIKNEEMTARNGVWREGPGERLLSLLIENGARLIAEDLGVLTDEVLHVRDKFFLPGMNVLAFAFEGDETNRFLPCHYVQNSVVYGGTHDNETLLGYFERIGSGVREFAGRYLGAPAYSPRALAEAVITAGYASVSDCVIMSMQDLLSEGNYARSNTPSTREGNWRYRLPRNWEERVSAEHLRSLCKIYDRK